MSKDAVFLSPHKFVGGVGCPGKEMKQMVVCDGHRFTSDILHLCTNYDQRVRK